MTYHPCKPMRAASHLSQRFSRRFNISAHFLPRHVTCRRQSELQLVGQWVATFCNFGTAYVGDSLALTRAHERSFLCVEDLAMGSGRPVATKSERLLHEADAILIEDKVRRGKALYEKGKVALYSGSDVGAAEAYSRFIEAVDILKGINSDLARACRISCQLKGAECQIRLKKYNVCLRTCEALFQNDMVHRNELLYHEVLWIRSLAYIGLHDWSAAVTDLQLAEPIAPKRRLATLKSCLEFATHQLAAQLTSDTSYPQKPGLMPRLPSAARSMLGESSGSSITGKRRLRSAWSLPPDVGCDLMQNIGEFDIGLDHFEPFECQPSSQRVRHVDNSDRLMVAEHALRMTPTENMDPASPSAQSMSTSMNSLIAFGRTKSTPVGGSSGLRMVGRTKSVCIPGTSHSLGSARSSIQGPMFNSLTQSTRSPEASLPSSLAMNSMHPARSSILGSMATQSAQSSETTLNLPEAVSVSQGPEAGHEQGAMQPPRAKTAELGAWVKQLERQYSSRLSPSGLDFEMPIMAADDDQWAYGNDVTPLNSSRIHLTNAQDQGAYFERSAFHRSGFSQDGQNLTFSKSVNQGVQSAIQNDSGCFNFSKRNTQGRHSPMNSHDVVDLGMEDWQGHESTMGMSHGAMTCESSADWTMEPKSFSFRPRTATPDFGAMVDSSCLLDVNDELSAGQGSFGGDYWPMPNPFATARALDVSP